MFLKIALAGEKGICYNNDEILEIRGIVMTIMYDAERLSRNRTTVMGVSTMLILWFHSTTVAQQLANPWLNFLKMTCDIGVDVFLLMSGIGIYFAVEKYPRYRDYLLGRVKRVIPGFLVTALIWFGYREFSWGGDRNPLNILWHTSTLSYWIEGKLSYWYVPSILLLYVVTPPYQKLCSKYPWLSGCTIAFVVAFDAVVVEKLGVLGHLSIFISRIPIYLTGLILGKAIQEKKIFRVNVLAVAAAASMCLFVVASCLGKTRVALPWSYKYLAYGPLAVILSAVIAQIPDNPVMNYFGKRSLEYYLLYEKVSGFLADRRVMWPMIEQGNRMFYLVALVLTAVGVEVLRWICKWIWKVLNAFQKICSKNRRCQAVP